MGGTPEVRLTLEPDLMNADLSVLHRQMIDALGSGSPIIVDASAVQRAGAAALQLCAAFAKEAARCGATLSWTVPSRALHEASVLLGVQDMLCRAKDL